MPAHSQTHRHLEQTHILEKPASLEHWLGQAAWMRDHIQISNGLWPMPDRAAPKAQLSDFMEEDGYRIRTVVMETLPGFYLTGTLYYPDGEGPFPAILSAHGHWAEGRFQDEELASVPGRALTLARKGYVVFSYSMIGYNETQDLFPHRFDEPQYQLWGFSVMGLQLWNSIRALDLVESLPEVDPDRIGMTGASGGGTQTFLLTAIDQRIKAAAPVNMISAHFQGGCICENAPLLRQGMNNVEVGALTAPRPLLMVSTQGDWTVNTPDREFPAMQRMYELFDAKDHVKNVHLNYPHNYNKDSREAVYDWFARWLSPRDTDASEAPFTLTATTRTEGRLPKPPASPEQVFASFKAMAEKQLALDSPVSWSSVEQYRAQFGPAMNHILSPTTPSVPDLDLHVPDARIESGKALLIVHDDTEAGQKDAMKTAEAALKKGTMVAILALPLLDQVAPPPDSIDYWTTYNPTAAQHQVQEIIGAASFLSAQADVSSIDLTGRGHTGPLVLLARSQLPFVSDTAVDFQGLSFETDADFLHHANIPLIRRAGDFKTAAALVAPSRLTISGLPDGNLKSWIRALYQEFGAGDRLSMK